ncbi:Asp23/Gls24 family envelope stress response protein [Alkalihalobacterium chitinilyticum]|uniref:Asp23/Gls24 family envelope stress response protein n=1 Tax=Alkalihalobacterium chitinilyticum TaxID=2980103 RepID=A0ABT5VCT8_9BACI|nr:Asp23/Gls24 family envelope stress response protein [Alkalihalobacterium chitinilyticum]MDE5413100.1 Asp23/Gls24 family envelope stress response protein [Alkalihalobacterium chitinilyticum]
MPIQLLEDGQLHIKEKVIIDLIYFSLENHYPYIKPYNEWKKRVRNSLNRNEKYGIAVVVEENSLKLDVSLSVLYGSDFRELTKTIQKVIKHEIEYCTGFIVERVSIKIEDIHFDD